MRKASLHEVRVFIPQTIKVIHVCSPIRHAALRDIFIRSTARLFCSITQPLEIYSMTTPASSSPDPAGLKAGRPPPYDARHPNLCGTMAHFGIPALLIVDPINIFCATGAHKSRQPASPIRVLDSLRVTSQ